MARNRGPLSRSSAREYLEDEPPQPHDTVPPSAFHFQGRYLLKHAFLYQDTPHRKYTSVQRPRIHDTELKDFVTNRHAKDPKDEELAPGSTLLMSGESGPAALPLAAAGSPFSKGGPMVSGALTQKQLNMPRHFDLVHKNKIQLLREFLGPDIALKASKMSKTGPGRNE